MLQILLLHTLYPLAFVSTEEDVSCVSLHQIFASAELKPQGCAVKEIETKEIDFFVFVAD